jgi:serine/threonine protein kinase
MSVAATYEIPAGTVLGKYEVLRKLAVGGMAEIYVARTRGAAGFEKLVVLKRILPNVAQDPAFVQMFLEEARLAATLSHPNIADVYDVGEVDGTYFFTMEFIHGEDARTIRFATKKQGERAPLSIALAIVHGTAAALDYAHEKGVVHRDISSSNILVSYDGAVKLVDFGIARATSSDHKTRTGTLKGKIPYMSPEQCRGHQVDRRSDLFSLGTVLYELTVGRRPFRGDTDFAMMEQIVHHDARPPTEIDPEYPRQLEAIVRKLLARDVNARYQNAEHLLHDLESSL